MRQGNRPEAEAKSTRAMYKYFGLCLALASVAGGHEPDTWHPFQQSDLFPGSKPSFHATPSGYGGLDPGYHHGGGDQCEVYKVGFTQDLYFQYIQYKTDIPDTKQFTLCYWSKFYNHSNDHPIFSYAVDGQPRAIYSLVSNTERSSYFSLSVDGHTFYRLNYPLRLNRWYHTCQSWNGKTGEWQIWVNAERVGRGFHNRLVGHTIPGGGIAITGQEQSQLGGGFQEGIEAPKGSGGMLGEITMVQFYKVALTAGKAHKDHKHHHAHKYDHDGRMITTPAPTTPRIVSRLPMHPLLTGGQINRNVRVNLAAGQQPQVVPGQSFDAHYLNGQFLGSLVSQQLTQAQGGPQRFGFQPQQQPIAGNSNSFSSQFFGSGLGHDTQTIQYLDNGQSLLETHNLFKRQNEDTAQPAEPEPKFGDKIVAKRDSDGDSNDSKQKKRELYLSGGTIFDNQYIDKGGSNEFDQSLLYGLAGIGQNQVIAQQQKQTEDEREPAEAEVQAVLNVCTGCDPEPFDKALVFGWRTVPKKLYSGAFYTPAVAECRAF